MNPYLAAALTLLILDYLLTLIVERLNLRHFRSDIPEEFAGWFDEEKYGKSQRYLADRTRFGLVKASISTPLLIVFILAGGFGYVDSLCRSVNMGMIPTGLLFAGALLLVSGLVTLPFSVYGTYVLEARYGFNTTRPWTFVTDILKSMLIGVVLGGPLLAGLFWFFSRAGSLAWVWSWLAFALFQIFLVAVAPVTILPLFNKFTPLEEGELKTAIEDYAKEQRYSLKGIYSVDGSKRSKKSNAYFTGFGRWRRIALFDTLIAGHGVDELVSILAHEVGHQRRGHIWKGMVVSLASAGLMLFLLSQFISQPGLYHAFQLDTGLIGGYPPIYGGFICFGFLFAPVSLLLSIGSNALSRRFEFQADRFAVETTSRAEAFIRALKTLSVSNLSNLAPHPWKVFLEFSHPPVLERIRAIRGFGPDGHQSD